MQTSASRFARVLSPCLGLIIWATASVANAAFVPCDFKPNVVDEAHVLSDQDIARINARIKDLRDSSGIFAAVYVVPSLNGDSIEQAATVTFEKWKLGQIGEDNGLLIILSISEKRARIEMSHGLKSDIPDGVVERFPFVLNKGYADGLDSVLATVALLGAKDASKLSFEQKWTAYVYRQATSGTILSYPGLWPFYAWLLSILFIPIAGRAWRWATRRPLDHRGRPLGAEALLHVVLGPRETRDGKRHNFLFKLFLCINPGSFIAIVGFMFPPNAKIMAFTLGISALGIGTSAWLSFANPDRRDRALRAMRKIAIVTFTCGIVIAIVLFGGWLLVSYAPWPFAAFIIASFVYVWSRRRRHLGGESDSSSSWESSSSSWGSSSGGDSSGGGGSSDLKGA